MPQKGNTGAMGLRAPSKEPSRSRYLAVKDLIDDEIARNKASRQGPRTYPEILILMGEHRYAKQIKANEADAARVKDERKGNPPPALDAF